MARLRRIWAAFVMAVRKRFARSGRFPQVIRYVASVRSHRGQDANDIDSRTAETLMRRAVEGQVDTDLDEMTTSRAQLFL
jgi:hypothetical protein